LGCILKSTVNEKSLEENKTKAVSQPINIDYTHKLFPHFDRIIAQGAYSTVHPCQFGEQSAVIKVPRTFDDDDRRTLGSRNAHQREINFFNQSLFHDHIIRLYSVFIMSNLSKTLVLERWGIGLDRLLSHYGRGLPPEYGEIISIQLLSAVNFLHDNNVAHSDLKPGNILFKRIVSKPFIKIIDFGFAVTEGDDYRIRGSWSYMSPEIFAAGYNRDQFGVAAPRLDLNLFKGYDMWAAGVVLFTIVANYQPVSFQVRFNAGLQRRCAALENKKQPADKSDVSYLGNFLYDSAKRRYTHPEKQLLSVRRELVKYMLIFFNAGVPKQKDMKQLVRIVLQPKSKRLATLCGSLLVPADERLNAAAALSMARSVE
jgi:serine/threonine protein kinase